MPEYAFVSCDIVGHSGQSDLDIQERRIVEINRIVRGVIESAPAGEVVWASGGDGGHVGFASHKFPVPALALIRNLRAWSHTHHVPLRIVASLGDVIEIEGADGRVQLVGHGINLAGRLLQLVDEPSVFATEGFYAVVRAAGIEQVRFHDSRIVELPYFGQQSLYLVSVPGEFVSVPTTPASDEHMALQHALDGDNAFEALYRSKRLLQLNTHDRAALAALEKLAGRRELVRDDSEIGWLILDRNFSTEFIRGTELIERRKGDVICRYGDEGTTMFLIVRGVIAGSPTPDATEVHESRAPTFQLGPGTLFGELAFLLGRPRTATIWCLEDAALLQFSYEKLKQSSSALGGELEKAVNRTAKSHIAERVARSSPFLAGEGGPLEGRVDETSSAIRRFADLITCPWPRYDVITPASDAVRAEGLYILVSGALRAIGTNEQLRGDEEPLIYADIPGEVAWRANSYLLEDDVKLLAINPQALQQFGAPKYRDILGRLRTELGLAVVPDHADTLRVGARGGRVFISYSHADSKWLRELTTHLQPFVDQELVELWDDTRIKPGTQWLNEIEKALTSSNVAVLLVSPAFLESRFVKTKELPVIFRKAEEQGLAIIWIPVRHSAVKRTPIGDYQAALNPDTPLESMSPAARNKHLTAICEVIAEARSSRPR